MKTTKISVIITVKNTSEAISACLSGFLNQTVIPQIIIVGPNKDIEKIKKSLNRGQIMGIQFIDYLGGKNEARNIGFNESSGDFVLYSDQDMIPETNLMEKSTKMLKDFDAIIIPEKGTGGPGFLEKVHSLEKELVMEDVDALTPRLFKRSMFNNGEVPFDRKFGILDEWGFNLKLKTKNPRIGIVKSFFTVENNLTLLEEMKKNFKKGLWIRNLIAADKEEGLRRINPVKRGIQFYGKRLVFLKKEPIFFSGLVLLKFIDLASFFLGYLTSFVVRSQSLDDKVSKLS
ncbi:glycosyltransferase family 2 protein [Candidatus Gottesmanbacteria bacterium]|nr:glycosyltransferase family 2 protein [Candidatus Gottesmanbacteria bacterium]